ncbi:MAG: leucine-rich repeat protein [Verrucomicrobiota bacterium]|nr:leucine-rich repeat protein [Verrucomicrobiota bacterium]
MYSFVSFLCRRHARIDIDEEETPRDTPIVRLQSSVRAAVSGAWGTLVAMSERMTVRSERAIREERSIEGQDASSYGLVRFYEAFPSSLNALIFYGTVREQAEQIREWQSTSEAVQQCTSLDVTDANLFSVPPEIRFFRNLEFLNLHGNFIRALPGEIRNLERLQDLDLSFNEFRDITLPNNFPMLNYVNLSFNQLTNVRGLSNMSSLKKLDLSGNQISDLTGLDSLVSLQMLKITHNQIDDIRVIGRISSLTNLNLSDNSITNISMLYGLNRLENLSLCNNRISNIAVLGHLPSLKKLYLNRNRIQQLTPLRNLHGLEELFVSRNSISSVLVLGFLHSLKRLDVSYNNITDMDVFLTFPQACDIKACDNQFTYEYASRFQQRLLTAREQNPELNVEISIASARNGLEENLIENQLIQWTWEFATAYPPKEYPIDWEERQNNFASLMLLDEKNKENLNKYLCKLRDTADYQNQTARRNLVLRVERMIQLSLKNREFREKILALIAEGLTGCEDRILITFNEIEIQWQLHCKELSEEEVREFSLRVGNFELLKTYAMEVAKADGLGDVVEVMLSYQLSLRELLSLPITTQGMLYPDMAPLTPEKIQNAYERISSCSELERLAKSKVWNAHQKKKLPDRVTELEGQYASFIDVAMDYFQNEQSERQLVLESAEEELKSVLKESKHIVEAAGKIAEKRELAIAGLRSD